MSSLPVRVALTLVLIFGPVDLGAQSVLTIRERSPGGDTLDIGKAGIVDINSTLLIAIDRERIRQLASEKSEPAQAISELLRGLESVVRVRDVALAMIVPALATWSVSAKDDAARAALQDSLRAVLTGASQIIDAALPGTRLRDRLNTALRAFIDSPEGGFKDLYGVVFTVAADEADALRLERDSLLKVAGVFVQVGGWSVTAKGSRPLHFPGFDENPDLEAFDVERFGLGAIVLTEEQKRDLARAADVAKSFNEGGAGAALTTSGLRSAVSGAVLPLLEQGTVCIDQIRAAAAAIVASPGPDAVKSDLRAALVPLEGVRSFILGLKEKYRSEEGASGQTLSDLLIATNDDIAAAFRRVEGAKTALIELHQALAGHAALGGGLGGRLNNLRAEARSCVDGLETKVAATRASADALLKNLLGVREINADILAFTESVLRLDIANIPAGVDFRLRFAGERKAGDRLLIRALVGSADEESPPREDHELTMFQVERHLETVVGLVFADPLGSSELRGRFQAGPAYSILLKSGSRKSEIRNRLLLVGLGLNVAAFDFDHDDNPELGVGAVVSFLGDYLQGGVGYNIPSDRGYWFFGLRLPLPTFTLPGAEEAEDQ